MVDGVHDGKAERRRQTKGEEMGSGEPEEGDKA